MILASSSPRRRELLTQIGVRFRIQAADIDETPFADEPAVAYVERMALEKARKVAEEHPQEVVLGSDTSVIFAGEILGKPVNNREAEETLQRLSGQTHQVLSAVAVVKGDREKVISVATEVTFRSLSDEEIDYTLYDTTHPNGTDAYGTVIENMNFWRICVKNLVIYKT